MKTKSGKWHVYMLLLDDNTYYTGITNHLKLRLKKHRSGHGSKYVYGRLPCKIVYVEEVEGRSKATKRELFIKNLRHNQKVNIAELYNKKYGEYKE